MTTRTTRPPADRDPVEIADGVWRIAGFFGSDFTRRPPSSNAYVLLDGADLYVVDPGLDRHTRAAILGLIARHRSRIDRVRLLVTQGHFDHSSNADLLTEVDLPWEFLLPEVEVPTMHSVADFRRDLDALARYEDVFGTMFARTPLDAPMSLLGRVSPSLARAVLCGLIGLTMGRGDHFAGHATLLRPADRVSRRIGDRTFTGWPLGRFFVIHDGAHSPGHLCLYDPREKLVLAGDATVEINPAFLYSSMSELIRITSDLAALARQGLVDQVADGHRSPASTRAIERATGLAALNPTQRLPLMATAEQSEEFLTFFASYYRSLVDAVVAARERLGPAPVRALADQLRRDRHPDVRFKAALRFPGFPSRLDVLVAQVAHEQGWRPERRSGNLVLV